MDRVSNTLVVALRRAVSAHHRLLPWVLGMAFLLRFGWLLHARPEPVSDYLAYRELGENLIDHGFFGLTESSALYLPGHPALLAGLMTVARGNFWLSLVMVLMSTVACLLVYHLARALTGRDAVALVAAGACAVSPTFVVYSPLLATEHLFAVLMLGVVLLAVKFRAGGPTAIVLGVMYGLAVLTRGEAIFYGPVVLAVLWFGLRDRAVWLRQVALVGLGGLLVVGPWVVRNTVVIEPGVLLSTVGGINFYYGHNPNHYGWHPDVPWDPNDDVQANRTGWELGLEHVRDHPESILTSIRDGTTELFSSPTYPLIWSRQQPAAEPPFYSPKFVRLEGSVDQLLRTGGGLYLALAGAGFLAWRRWPVMLRVVVPGVALTSWLGHAVLFFGSARFRFFLDVVLTILVALTVVALWEWSREEAAPSAPGEFG